MNAPLLVGAVAYSPNVVPIWEGIREYFAGTDTEMDFVLLLELRPTGRRADRGSDRRRVEHQPRVGAHRPADGRPDAGRWPCATRMPSSRRCFVAQAGAGLSGLDDLRGRRLALGSQDSAQAAILPVQFLLDAGIAADDVELLRINSDVGKHGDTGRSELDAIRAVLAGEADAAAIGINTWEAIGRDELMPGALEAFWTSPVYSHCNFTVLSSTAPERYEAWVDRLMQMDWENPAHRPIMEMEGLRAWVAPQLDGYESLFRAVREQGISPRW